MEPEVEFTFCQSDLPCIAFTIFDEMQKNGEFCDLTIKIQDYSISAHRVILAAVIPFFRPVFSCSGAETQERDITMSDLDPRAIELIIRFAYSSKLNISTENVQSLLAASQFFQLSQVQDACVEFLTKRLTVGSFLQVRTFALSLNNTNLIENSNRYIRENFDEFSKSEGFVDLPHSHVKEIISEDDLNVSSEEIVLDAVMTWVKKSPSERCGLLPDLLSEVRMIYIPGDSLKQISREELVRSSPFCRDLLEEVKSYHLWPEEKSLFSNLKLQRRKHHVLNEKTDALNEINYALQEEAIFALCVAEPSDHLVVCVYYRDFVKNVWNNLVYKPFARYSGYHYVASVEEKIYIIFYRMIQCFHPKTREWKSIEIPPELTNEFSAPLLSRGIAVVSHKNMIYFLGSDRDDFARQVFCFDPELEKWSDQTRMFTRRRFAAAASLGECIYVTGGSYIVKRAERYNSSTGECSEIAPMLDLRIEHGCTSMNGKIYVCGGIQSPTTAEVYDPLTDQWSYISSMESERHEFTLLSLNNQLYAFGGRVSKYRVKNCGEIYDPESDQWMPSFLLPEGFRNAMLVQYTKQ